MFGRLPSQLRQYELSPSQVRFIFSHQGWSKIVGFHTRNVVHQAHRHIQLEALTRCNGDGLFISPVVGPKKVGDFLPKPVLESYQVLLDAGEYPIENTLLGTFSTYPRYAGPREAVFTAMCRKNFGCSHFIIGRDHAGVGDYYPVDANRKIFDVLGDIGIEPIFFDEIVYNSQSNSYGSAKSAGQNISGTEARQIILSGNRLPNWFMHDQVQDHLLRMMAENKPIFYN
jgi:ATP sulfurylase